MASVRWHADDRAGQALRRGGPAARPERRPDADSVLRHGDQRGRRLVSDPSGATRRASAPYDGPRRDTTGLGAVAGVLIGGTLANRLGPRNATVISMFGTCVIIGS
jgi:hypothetical protein